MGGRPPLLGAALIVRDEAQHLRRCLPSISDVCDEIVVVDTGSTDESVAVARGAGARVVHRAWDDDFSAARNHALEQVSARWVLYIDADEVLDAPDPTAARRELMDSTDAVALRVRFRSRPGWSPYREYRLWQRRDDIRFVGRIHETMVPDITRIASHEDRPISDSAQLSITHYGYEGDLTRKHQRNLPLLERRVVEHPTRCYLWNHLGNVRAALGDPTGAVQAWSRGVALVRERGIVDRTDALVFAGLGLHLAVRGIDVSDLVEEARRHAPWYLTIDWIAATNHVHQRRFADAVPHLRRLLGVGTDPEDPTLAYNNSMFTLWPARLLGDCLIELGDLAAAADAYRMASGFDPGDLELRSKAVALRTRATTVRSSTGPG